RSRQLAGLRLTARFDRWSGSADHQPFVVQLEDQLDRPGAVGAHHGVTELVDGDAEILDLVEGQPGAAAGVGGGQARKAQEVGPARDDQPDLDRMFGHSETPRLPSRVSMFALGGLAAPRSVRLATKRRKTR